MTRDELLARIRDDRARFDAALARVSDDHRLEAALDSGWSVKDVLAHVSFWERTCERWLASVARGETPGRPEVRDVDATNAAAYTAAKDRALADVTAESRASYEAIVRATTALPDATLADDQRFGFPVSQMIDGNSGEHYREHAEQMEAWLAANA